LALVIVATRKHSSHEVPLASGAACSDASVECFGQQSCRRALFSGGFRRFIGCSGWGQLVFTTFRHVLLQTPPPRAVWEVSEGARDCFVDWTYKIGIDRMTRGSDDGHQKGRNVTLRGFSSNACYEYSVSSCSLYRLLRLDRSATVTFAEL
jgi:hypothetical protein